jgi:hypothetical protein
MIGCFQRAGCLLLVLTTLGGCGTAQPQAVRTGAEEAVRDYYEAIRRGDWGRAYELLHPDTRARWNAEGFARLAEGYRRQLGFEPDAIHLRSCEEQGAEAKAHVVFEGRAGGRLRFFRDAAELRRSSTGWGVVLPQRFGAVR